jgi:hypothetical protein
MLNLHTLKLSLLAATAATACAIVQPAHATTTCAEGGRVLTVTLTDDGDAARIYAPSTLLFVDGKNGQPIACAGTATTTYVDTILINDVSDDPSTLAGYDGTTSVTIDDPALLAPGHTQEVTKLPGEIEVLADPKGGEDRLTLDGD